MIKTPKPTQTVEAILWSGLGKMGQALAATAEKDQKIKAVYCPLLDDKAQMPPHHYSNKQDLIPHLPAVIIDFTTPEGHSEALAFARAHGAPLLSGTTALSEAQFQALKAASQEIPIFYAQNMSLGVHVLAKLATLAAEILPQADIEVLDIHHNAKLDTPSGTALWLAERLAAARANIGQTTPTEFRSHGIKPRTPDSIGLSALRLGQVAGEHQIHLALGHERLTLTHSAMDRKLFAQGAWQAAAFLGAQPAGLYHMSHLVNDLLTSKPS